MIKVTNTLSRMVMAAPLTFAASSALSSDAGAQRFDMHHDAATASIVTQWRVPDQIKPSGNQTLASAEWSQFHGIAGLGVTPVIHRRDDSRTAWYVEEGKDGHQLATQYSSGWRRQSAADGFGGHMEASYMTRSGVDLGLSLQYGFAAGYRHPDNTVHFAASSTCEATWTWTQTT